MNTNNLTLATLDKVILAILDKIDECARTSLRLDKIPQSYDKFVLQKSADQTRVFLQEILGLPNYSREVVQKEVERLKVIFKNES